MGNNKPNLNAAGDVLHRLDKLRLHVRFYENILVGIFLGYSKESMAQYISRVIALNTDQAVPFKDKQWQNTGFIPCDADMVKGYDTVRDEINSRRIYTEAFPTLHKTSFEPQFKRWKLRDKTPDEIQYIEDVFTHMTSRGLIMDLSTVPDFITLG